MLNKHESPVGGYHTFAIVSSTNITMKSFSIKLYRVIHYSPAYSESYCFNVFTLNTR